MKRRLEEHPRNGLLWVDLARRYALLGADKHAARSMQNGLFLAPESRFVLRSAARLYIHLNEPEQAYEILRRSPATRRDPWLRAAEIAVAGVMGKNPRRLKETKRILNRGSISPKHISELAGATATCELTSGSDKSARRLFQLGLEQPTENTVAQANWASKYLDGISLYEDHLSLPGTFEARAQHHFDSHQWNECISACAEWFDDEPFSSRPMVLGTFVAIAGLEDYGAAVRLAEKGLMSNPGHFLLRNNLVVGLVEAGNVAQARNEYAQIRSSSLLRWERACWLATEGLLAFGENRHSHGRSLYCRAVACSQDESNKRSEAMALIHWAREELKAGYRERADELASQADRVADGISDTGIKIAIGRYHKLQRTIPTNSR